MKFFLVVTLSFFVVLFANLFLADQATRLTLISQTPQRFKSQAIYQVKTLTLNEIFNKEYTPLEYLNPDKIVVLLATGDVMVGRSVNIKAKTLGSYDYPYQEVLAALNFPDITLINLEGPVVENCPTVNSGFVFCGDPQHIASMARAGIDVANLANNHILNFGKEGLEITKNSLSLNNILASDSDKPSYMNAKGTRFAFLGYNDLDYPTAQDLEKEKVEIAHDIQEAKIEADVVVVSMHWGNEYQPQPTERQKELGHFIIDTGADLVIGNHPHWIQPVEVYKHKIIAYSHGNFIFDQTWSEKTKEGVVGKYTFYQNQIIDVDFLPIYIEQIGQPKLANPSMTQRILTEMQEASLRLLENRD